MPTLRKNAFNREASERITNLLIREKLFLNELEVENPAHIQGALDYFYKMPSRLKTISGEKSMAFVEKVIEKDYKLFVYLDKKQYNEKLCKTFLNGVISATQKSKGEATFASYMSYDGKIVLDVNYETHKGEEVYYFDNELKVPASLISKIKISLRIENYEAFIKMLDISVQEICSPIIYNHIIHLINASYREELSAFISDKNSGYYKLTNSLTKFEAAIAKRLNTKFDAGCAKVAQLMIVNIDVDRGTREVIEEEFFQLRKKRMLIDEEITYQKESLDLFVKKGEILSKNPNMGETLTEAEKDKALDRYLSKVSPTKAGSIRGKSLLEKRELDSANGGIEKKADSVTVIRKYSKLLLNLVFAILFTGGFVTSVLSLIGVVEDELLILGIILIVLSIIVKIINKTVAKRMGSEIVDFSKLGKKNKK